MRLVCISDTHMRHRRLVLPAGDVLVHAGDATRHGTGEELREFLGWMRALPFSRKLLIAGNHDFVCERDEATVRDDAAAAGVTYLRDEALVIDGVRFWGSPATPRFRDMAFNVDRGPASAAVWAKIPAEVDVLVTHGPPEGVGDRMILGAHVGCADLRARVLALQPRVHLFGHIHEAAGEHRLDGCRTRFYNVASLPFPLGVSALLGRVHAARLIDL